MHLSLLKRFPLFLWLLFTGLFLISALTQAGESGLLFRFASSVLLWGGRGTADKCHCLCGEHSQCSGHTGFAPSSWRMCFPHLHCSGSRLLYRERALSCMWFPFSGTPQKRRLGWACILCLPHPSSSGSQELDERTLLGCGAPFPLRCTLCLFWRAGL